MRVARRVLIAAGGGGLILGGWLLLASTQPVGLVGLAVWLAVAVLLHDAVLSPLLFGVGWLLRLGARRVPLAAVAVVQVAALVGGIGSLLLLPAIHAKRLGTRNPSVLPLDYVAHLAGLWLVLAVVTAAVVAAVLVAHMRRDRARVGRALPRSASR